jgi:hypothetical protein
VANSVTFSPLNKKKLKYCSKTRKKGLLDREDGGDMFLRNFGIQRSRNKVKVKLSLCLTNYPLRHEGVWGSGCIDPRILDLGGEWSASRPLGKSPPYPLDRWGPEPVWTT